MLSRKIFPLLVALTVITIRMQGQIYAPDANASFNAAYNMPNGVDKVFVFNKPTYKAGMTASIKAVSVDSMSDWSFQWAVFDWVTETYNVIASSNIGWFSEIDTITVSSGYKVEMIRGADTSTYRIWLLINDLDIKITNKDEADTLLFGYYNCSSIDFRAETTKIPLFYYNLETEIISNVGNSYRIRWKTDNDEASVPPPQLITRVSKPPSKDTWYKLTVTDNFGLIRSDSVFYKSIQSEAHIKANYISMSDTAEYPGKLYKYFYDSLSHSAPGKFSFDVSESRNMVSYKIDFRDNETVTLGGDSLHVIHEYKKPGTYNVVLTTKSAPPFECLDKDSVGTDLVKLAEADEKNFIMPNVFTPNNDGYNDKLELTGNLDELYSKNNFFRSDDISVLTIDISIFSRSGRKVHEYAGSIREWQGWDGKIMNSDRDAPEGVYFYVITQLSAYEDKANPINRKIFKGFLHLYRE